MLTLIPQDADCIPDPSPAYLAWIREGALIAIKNNLDPETAPIFGLTEVAEEITRLRRMGVSPDRAAVMLDRNKTAVDQLVTA